MLKKLNECIAEKSQRINLTDKDFQSIEAKWNDLPDTMCSLIEMIEIEKETKIVMSNIGGSNSACLVSRFSDSDDEIFDFVDNVFNMEEKMNPDKILAEIIHLPQARTGNILKRKNTRGFEIPYIGKSSLSIENQIFINDIMVLIKNDRVILRSKKHNKEIPPRLTTAHNFKHDYLPI